MWQLLDPEYIHIFLVSTLPFEEQTKCRRYRTNFAKGSHIHHLKDLMYELLNND